MGISFREWDAGHLLDSYMHIDGFNIELKLDEVTGFINGGSNHNSLTWMEVIGKSEESGNRGIAPTSRDGAPIECTALLKLCLDFAFTLFK